MAEQHTFPFSSKHRFPEWQTEFEAVLLEGNSERLSQCVQVAEAAIFFRLQSLVNIPNAEVERLAIADAKRMMALVQNVDKFLEGKLAGYKNDRGTCVLLPSKSDLTFFSTTEAGFRDFTLPLRTLVANKLAQRSSGISPQHETPYDGSCQEEMADLPCLYKNPATLEIEGEFASTFPEKLLAEKASSLCRQLNLGDRVEGLGNFGKPLKVFGTVEKVTADGAAIRWDDNQQMTLGRSWFQKI